MLVYYSNTTPRTSTSQLFTVIFSLQLDDTPLIIEHPMACVKIHQNRSKPYKVALKLKPVGATWRIENLATLQKLCSSILTTLKVVHSLGYVHRDIRIDNIVLAPFGFVLIDWEVAAPSGSLVFWDACCGSHPDGVLKGSPWLPWMDLWQVGRLISVLAGGLSHDPVITTHVIPFQNKLLNQEYGGAEDAIRDLNWVDDQLHDGLLPSDPRH